MGAIVIWKMLWLNPGLDVPRHIVSFATAYGQPMAAEMYQHVSSVRACNCDNLRVGYIEAVGMESQDEKSGS